MAERTTVVVTTSGRANGATGKAVLWAVTRIQVLSALMLHGRELPWVR
jgi:hypothetical protein